ncbi:MAG: Na/Pi cotransporter family protein [Proteobacteria bacterium]|nr:MAG: Na/Pi cotransporter family protein [Pseudomonadota bacterium]QKK11710.1 MAG: Na/Pi cotransporter family protein [Pseudomonadota bacterium]
MLLTIGSLLGGLGLFLLAIRMITDGLRLAAGSALREMLGVWTRTPARGIAAGVLITAIVQSSSAVTAATIGFVNSGLLSLTHALGVVYGANIGTTAIGWLVAAVGFKVKLELFALPIIGAGVIMRLVGGTRRTGAIGEALAGFGLFFLGIQVLKDAFEGLATGIQFHDLAADGFMSTLLFVSIGFVMTLLMQASGAAIAITLTAANSGVIPLAAAASMVIGANIGTTSTAALAVIGATSNAKRVAMAHIFFNALTGAVALLLLPVLLWGVAVTSRVLALEDSPAVALALFHTVFNLLGVALMWPLTPHLAVFLARRFRSEEEVAARPKYLDKTIVVSPELAIEALALEVARMGQMARATAHAALNADLVSTDRLQKERHIVFQLANEIGNFTAHLERGSLPSSTVEILPSSLRTARYYTALSDLAVDVGTETLRLSRRLPERLAEQHATFIAKTKDLLSKADPKRDGYTAEAMELDLDELQQRYQALKAAYLEAGATGQFPIPDMAEHLEYISRTRRMAEQSAKGARYLHHLMGVGQAPAETHTN